MAEYNTTGNASFYRLDEEYLIFSALGSIGCLLNGFVCVIISTRKALRQPFNHLILNLSVANFILSLAIILYGLSNYLAAILNLRNLPMDMANFVCKLDLFCFQSSLTATCLTLFIISIERYQAVTAIRLHKIELSVTRKFIVCIWIVASISPIIPTCFGEIDPQLYYSCHYGRISSFLLVFLSMLFFSVSCILPALFMLTTYGLIIYKLYINIQVSPVVLSKAACNRKKILRRSIIAIIFISVLSIGSCVPFFLLNVIIFFGQHYQESYKSIFIRQNMVLWNFFTFTFMLTPVINPLLYNLASSQFRDVLYGLCCTRCHYLCSKAFETAPEPIKCVGTSKSQSTKLANNYRL